MSFVKRTWVDRVATNLSRRVLNIVSSTGSGAGSQIVADVQRGDSDVTVVGDALNAANLNDLEQRIEDGIDSVTYPDYDGTARGLVPLASTADQLKFLRGDGTWQSAGGGGGGGGYACFKQSIYSTDWSEVWGEFEYTITIPSGYKYVAITSIELRYNIKKDIAVHIDGTSLVFSTAVKPDNQIIVKGLIFEESSEYGGYTQNNYSYVYPHSISFDSGDIATGSWSSVSSGNWRDSTPTQMGETSGTVYEADIPTDFATDDACFKLSSYNQSVCPARLWVYVTSGHVYIQTSQVPTGTFRLKGELIYPD